MLSSIENNIVNTVWHKKFFDASQRWLSDDEYRAMIDEKSDIVVSSFIPSRD